MDDFKQQIHQLTIDNDRLTTDLMRMSAKFSDADEKVRRWQTELEIVASKEDHNLCHIWVPELLERTLGHTGKFLDPKRMTKQEFRLGCCAYQDDIFGPDKPLSFSGRLFNRKAVFLDRDGTMIKIIERPEHKKKYTAPFIESELEFIPDVQEALDLLRRAGYLRIMITNQPDVANGYMSENEWWKIHNQVMSVLDLNDFHMCRHATDSGCTYHKPSSSMLLSMADKWGINLSESVIIGDSEADIKAGKSAGCKTLLIDANYNQHVACDARVTNLMAAVRVVLTH